jgi:hypothetical protein
MPCTCILAAGASQDLEAALHLCEESLQQPVGEAHDWAAQVHILLMTEQCIFFCVISTAAAAVKTTCVVQRIMTLR